ncbi:MAG: sulfotransferase family protein [Candidatus Parabeggiatoa sp. nov. 1]|nr:MAG: sulfotransferase family protein [Gammaproteobacteria bacterium]
MGIKIIGAGFGRTGTTSLRVALEELGFGKCYHVYHLFEHPREIEFWEALNQGKPVNWETFFEGYQSIIGFPGYYFYRQLMLHYPYAKVILSVREPEKWYDSISETIIRAYTEEKPTEDSKGESSYLNRVYKLEKDLIFKGYFQDKFENKPYVIKRFQQRVEEVKSVVPATRLLVYEITQGWEPLCRFLNIPVPEDKPFPRLNEREIFAQSAFPRKELT